MTDRRSVINKRMPRAIAVGERERRKQQTAELVLAGLSSKAIAEQLGVDVQTIDRYRSELSAEGLIPRYANQQAPHQRRASL